MIANNSMTINNFVDSLVNSETPFTNGQNELQKLNYLLGFATGHVSLWGERRIRVRGYKNSVSIDRIVEIVEKFPATRLIVDDQDPAQQQLWQSSGRKMVCFTPKERLFGISVIAKLKCVYTQTDQMMLRRNKFTRLLNKVREYMSQFKIDSDEMEKYYKSYNQSEFFEVFRKNETPIRPNLEEDYCLGPMSMHVLSKEEIECLARADLQKAYS